MTHAPVSISSILVTPVLKRAEQNGTFRHEFLQFRINMTHAPVSISSILVTCS
jgi:hypothetical protein